MGNYDLEYQRSVSDPEGFWAEQAQKLSWFSSPKEILSQDENGVDRWFADGILNTAYLALDYHVEQGRGDQGCEGGQEVERAPDGSCGKLLVQ